VISAAYARWCGAWAWALSLACLWSPAKQIVLGSANARILVAFLPTASIRHVS
jgi:hypothetical protein